MTQVELPSPVQQKALHVGPDGEQWLADLPRLVAELEEQWGLAIGESLAGGSAAYVARARTRDGRDCVLKIALPSEDFDAQLLRTYCALLAENTGIDEAAIWEWGFVERVSSGLYCMRSGLDALGRQLLETAERLGRPASI